MLSDKYLRFNLKKFGFQTYDTEVKELFETFLVNFLKNKAGKKAPSGGRTVLPSEYFGKESPSYFESLANNGTDMSVTNSMIRPSIQAHDLTGAITGGNSQCFSVSLRSLSLALKEAKVKVPKAESLQLKEEFEKLVGNMLRQMSKKQSCVLTSQSVRTESKKRQYKTLNNA